MQLWICDPGSLASLISSSEPHCGFDSRLGLRNIVVSLWLSLSSKQFTFNLPSWKSFHMLRFVLRMCIYENVIPVTFSKFFIFGSFFLEGKPNRFLPPRLVLHPPHCLLVWSVARINKKSAMIKNHSQWRCCQDLPRAKPVMVRNQRLHNHPNQWWVQYTRLSLSSKQERDFCGEQCSSSWVL